MAVPNYTKDLTDITLAESITGWTALGGGASGLGAGPDFSMEGTNCVDKQITVAEKGQIYNFGTTITPGTNTHFFVWVFLATPGLANTLALRGLGVVLGTATTAYNTFHVEGSDTYGAAGRVGKCYPIRYVTTSNGSVPYRTLTGTPGANPQYFGATANITGTVKSSNLGVDAIRYGTGIYITAGDATTSATFSGAASTNDAVTARWGILSFIAGSNYELQGRFVIGQDNTYTATAAYFVDSNKNILLINTPHSLTDFTQIIVDHASTVFNLTNITIEAAGTNNPGQLVFNNASTTSALSGCNFIKMGISTLRAGVTATNCTWRQTGQITLNGATLTSCKISSNTATSAVLAATPAGAALVSNTSFTSAGTGHAIEITGTATGITLTGNTYTGYAASNGITGNEVIYVNIASGSMTISITGGGSTPSIRTAGATVTVQNAVAVKVTVKDANTLAVINNARVLLEASSVATGTHTGTINAATLTDSSKSFTTNELVNYRIYNTTDGSNGLITANTATTVTATLAGGAENDWDTSDAYIIVALPALNPVSITRSGATASVSHKNHGMANSQTIVIRGAIQTEYNGIYTISNVSTNAYDYLLPDTGAGALTINVVASAGTFTRMTGSYLTDGFRAGNTITTSGFTGGNNATKVISAVTATVITVTDTSGLADETGNNNERVQDTPATPATGTITATALILTGLSGESPNPSGVVQRTDFNYTINQPVTGKVRRATDAYGTKYKTGALTGTITSAGFDTTALLIADQ